MRALQLDGMRVGKLIVIKRVGSNKNGQALWECICDCGNIAYQTSSSLNNQIVKSCGCAEFKFPKGNKIGSFRHLNKADAVVAWLYHRYERKAILTSKEFDLSLNEFRSLIIQPCYYCGTTDNILKACINHVDARKVLARVNGIDRVDNRFGYSVDNCVPCCTNCNTAKMTLTVDEYINLCKRVAERH